MSTELQYTSSIFQLALGVNGVFAFLINHFLSIRNRLVTEFMAKVTQLDPNIQLSERRRYLVKYLYRSMAGYRFFHAFFLVAISVAAISGALAFYYLLRAALAPTEIISDGYLTFLTAVMLLLNPIIYFTFYRASESLLSAVKEKMKIRPEDLPNILEGISLIEDNEVLDIALARSTLIDWKFKVKLHRIRIHYYVKGRWQSIRRLWHKRTKEEIDELLRELAKEEVPSDRKDQK